MNIAKTMTAPFMAMPGVDGIATATGRTLVGLLGTPAKSEFWMTPMDHKRVDTAEWGEPRNPVCYSVSHDDDNDGSETATSGSTVTASDETRSRSFLDRIGHHMPDLEACRSAILSERGYPGQDYCLNNHYSDASWSKTLEGLWEESRDVSMATSIHGWKTALWAGYFLTGAAALWAGHNLSQVLYDQSFHSSLLLSALTFIAGSGFIGALVNLIKRSSKKGSQKIIQAEIKTFQSVLNNDERKKRLMLHYPGITIEYIRKHVVPSIMKEQVSLQSVITKREHEIAAQQKLGLQVDAEYFLGEYPGLPSNSVLENRITKANQLIEKLQLLTMKLARLDASRHIFNKQELVRSQMMAHVSELQQMLEQSCWLDVP